MIVVAVCAVLSIAYLLGGMESVNSAPILSTTRQCPVGVRVTTNRGIPFGLNSKRLKYGTSCFEFAMTVAVQAEAGSNRVLV